MIIHAAVHEHASPSTQPRRHGPFTIPTGCRGMFNSGQQRTTMRFRERFPRPKNLPSGSRMPTGIPGLDAVLDGSSGP